MPPQIKASDEWTPKPPPRSKRNSRMGSRSSLATTGSQTSVNPDELSNKLKELQKSPGDSSGMTNADTSGGGQQPLAAPKRPPRFKRDKRIRNMTLPREMKLHSIAEDTQQQIPLDDSNNKQPKVPQPVGIASGTTSGATGTSGGPEGDQNNATNQPVVPVVPMPNNIPTKNDDVAIDSAQNPTVPMPMEFGTMEHWNGDTAVVVPKSTSLDEGINLQQQQPVVPQPQTPATLPTPKMGVHNEKLK